MVLRALGETGLRVSPLGLGTVKFGRNQGVKYPRAFELPDDRAVVELLALARELGINLLDTAPAYGVSEQRLGHLLPGPRSDWVIGTKVGETYADGESRFDFSAEATRASIERSLRRLHTDYLDYVLIHSHGDDLAVLQTDCLATLLALKRSGLIRAVGLSGKTVAGGLAALADCDLVMVAYNLQHRDEWPVIRAAHALGRGVLIKKGLTSGHLTGLDAADPLTASMRLLLGEPGVGSVVVGTLNPDHLRADVAAADRALGETG